MNRDHSPYLARSAAIAVTLVALGACAEKTPVEPALTLAPVFVTVGNPGDR